MTTKKSDTAFPACRSFLDARARQEIARICDPSGEAFSRCLEENAAALKIPPFLPDLARLEEALRQTEAGLEGIPATAETFTVNPSLRLLELSWKNLAPLAAGENASLPEEGDEIVMVWHDPSAAKVRVEAAGELDLLALKVTVEDTDLDEAAAAAGRSSGVVDVARWRAVRRGILLGPPSRIRRQGDEWPAAEHFGEDRLVSRGFTLQWHITQACDLHCRHCYDRSSRKAIPFDRAVAILDDLLLFCRRRHVSGHVTFTGGNPLMHSRFTDLYREASERGFTLSILGNPAAREELETILAVEAPTNYQVSLEGLEEHNDSIRGAGHYRRVMNFLPLLRELGVPSMVMLTLTEANIDQVIPLARRLEGVADSFFFNRLAAVGEGTSLASPGKERYAAFLEDYLEMAKRSGVAGLKDNLLNILLDRRGESPFGGCTGFGCGAAFNFVTLLAEGEAHACRKFPSPIGNVLEAGLEGVYDSDAARRYREGCASCRTCRIRPVCGGCLAVAYGQGLDPLATTDPHCFISEG